MQTLREVYQAVAAGSIDQARALEMIKLIKTVEAGAGPVAPGTAALFAAPVWVAAPLAMKSAAAVTRRVVLAVGAAAEALVGAGQPPGVRIIALQPGPAASAEELYTEVATQCFAVFKDALDGGSRQRIFVQVVTTGGGPGAVLCGLVGLLRTVQLEQPQFAGQVVLVESGPGTPALSELLAAEAAAGAASVAVRYTSEGRSELRLEEVASAGSSATVEGVPLRESGVFVVTGGLGGIGRLLAGELTANHPGARVVLTGRAAHSSELERALDALELDAPARARLSYRQLDLLNPAAVASLASELLRDYGGVNGIFHCAGVLADALIQNKSMADFHRVLAPKVNGTANLVRGFASAAPDFIALFSSMASYTGNVGQADYAAACGFQNGYASIWPTAAPALVSIAWPLWASGGMQVRVRQIAAEQVASGLAPIATTTAIAGLYRCLAAGRRETLVLAGDCERLRGSYLGAEPDRLSLGTARAASEGSPIDALDNPAVDGPLLARRTRALLVKALAQVLQIAPARVDPQAPFEHYGIDSIMAIDLTAELEKVFGSLSKTLFFEYRSLAELCDFFVETHAATLQRHFGVAEPTTPMAGRDAGRGQSRRSGSKPSGNAVSSRPRAANATPPAIAIIGLSGRYPQAWDVAEFWNQLAAGANCITEVPAERWDWREFYSEDRSQPGHYSKWGGFIEGAAEFDPRFFNIAPSEAAAIDPQERLFLQHSWAALEDAGYTRESLQIARNVGLPAQVGVYAGVMYGEYCLSGTLASIANRVSYFLDAHGPSMVVDSMCSSSLTAIHLACQDLITGHTDLALAGGVNLSSHPNKYTMLSVERFISSDGRCQSFGEGGDGYIPGEGVGVVVLKRVADAERDGDHIYGLIRATALNHGGRTNGYTVPNPQAQADVIRAALAAAAIDPRQVNYIEAHGTGTKLGDPIEIAALTKAYGHEVGGGARCPIGSVKSNIGHCESAAGVAGLTKILMQLEHRQLAPSLHSRRLNPNIDFSKTPFVVNQALREWPSPVVEGEILPRLAGLSSFGAGGSNAHILIEEYQSRAAAAAPNEAPQLVLLSARTEAQLRAKAMAIAQHLRRAKDIALADVAYTLQVGREAMNVRLAIRGSSFAEICDQLEQFATTGTAAGESHYDQAKLHRVELDELRDDAEFGQRVDQWLREGKLSELQRLWVKGYAVDWLRLPRVGPARRVPLPTYPFARERYWQPALGGASATVSVATRASRLHPLVHSNISSLAMQCYRSQFTADEPLLADFRVGGQPALSAAAFLEMACAAARDAEGAVPADAVVTLHACRWQAPLVAAAGGAVAIALVPGDAGAVAFEIYREADDQGVVCQGEVVVGGAAPAVQTLDLERLRAGLEVLAPGAWLRQFTSLDWHYGPAFDRVEAAQLSPAGAAARLRAGDPGLAVSSAFGFDLSAVEAALQLVAALMGRRLGASLALPTEIGSARIHSRGTVVYIEVRPSQAALVAGAVAAWDVDLADGNGRVVIELRAVQATLHGARAGAVTAAPPVTSHPERASEAMPRNTSESASPAVEPDLNLAAVRVTWQASGVVMAVLRAGAEPTAVLDDLARVLQWVAHIDSARVLLLRGQDGEFFSGDRAVVEHLLAAGVPDALVALPLPVVAMVDGCARGAGFMLAALCDFMVCGAGAELSLSHAGVWPTPTEYEFFAARFRPQQVRDWLLSERALSAAELATAGWSLAVADDGDLSARTQQLVAALLDKPREALELLVQHLRTPLPTAWECSAAPDIARIEERGTRDVRFGPVAVTARAGIATMRLNAGAADGENLTAALARALVEIVRQIQPRVIVLQSGPGGFLPAAGAEGLAELETALLTCACPVVMALGAQPSAVGLYLAHLADVVFYEHETIYQFAHPNKPADLLLGLEVALAESFGDAAARELMVITSGCRGRELERNSLLPECATDGDAATRAARFAERWGEAPPAAHWSIKAKARRLRDSAALRAAALTDGHAAAAPQARELPIASPVVTATIDSAGIVVAQMADREARNLFSSALVAGLGELFQLVERADDVRVVVLTGYDTYFCSGGTKADLLEIQAGEGQFTDADVYELPLKCRVPVIAAMQGHGIGAGWALGMFADISVFSEESHYVSPYMSYGFTPGAGSTLVLPQKLGWDLGRESLITARELTGEALARRQCGHPIAPRGAVLEAALTRARALADYGRSALLALKARWRAETAAAMPRVYAAETEMHARTFVGRGEVIERIERSFGVGGAQVDAAPALANPPRDIVSALGDLLAQELRLEPQEVEAHTPFIELGLDSISGVTFLRRVNERFGTAIEAAKIYSYPSVAEFAGYLRTHLGAQVAAPPTLDSPPQAGGSQAEFVGRSEVVQQLRELLAGELHLDAVDIDDQAQFVELGLDSITGVTWVRKLNQVFGLAIDTTEIYSHPNLAEFGRYVAAQLVAAARANVSPASAQAIKPFTSIRAGAAPARRSGAPGIRPEPVAVIGVSGKFPQAQSIDQFWANIAAGRDCIDEIPSERWDLGQHFQSGDITPGKTYSKWLGGLIDYACFDASFFGISPREAVNMDPQQRLFLQTCWHTVENAGYASGALSGTRCGVFVGCAAGDYSLLTREQQISAQGFTGAASSILAARISYFLNLRGPCLAIDTACSSSLVAIASACDSLRSHASDLALAGGVYVMAGPDMHIKTSQAGMLSPDGRCYAFDHRANGFVPGEAVGAVLLKRLADAERDGDRVLGVIEGWGVNQDGRTNGITAPSAEAQRRLLQEVYERFAIDPSTIELIEAHGTGTKLGDPIELSGLKEAFQPFTQQRQYCAVGSVKSNIGHCLTAAGVTGFIKVLQALTHRQLPPSINFERANEHLALEDSPFFINDRLRDWATPAHGARRAAISSFGFSGTNAHLVLAEYVAPLASAPAQLSRPAPMALLPLSAKTEDQLRQKVHELLAYLRATGDALEFDDLVYTLQLGRDAMTERLGVLAASADEYCTRLEQFLRQGADGVSVIHRGAADHRGAASMLGDEGDACVLVDHWLAQGKFAKVLELWTNGAEFDWSRLWSSVRRRRLALPNYPFARDTYWVRPGTTPATTTTDAAILHPLLHRNVSTVEEVVFTTRFNGQEAFLRQSAGGAAELPQLVVLEWACAAVAAAIPKWRGRLQFNDLVWGAPIVAGGEYNIALVRVDDTSVSFEIFSDSLAGADEQSGVIHCQGLVSSHGEASLAESIPLAALRQRLGAAECGEWLCPLRTNGNGNGDEFVLDPTVLIEVQARLAAVLLQSEAAAPTALAIRGIERAELHAPLVGASWLWCKSDAVDRSQMSHCAILDAAGGILLRLHQLSAFGVVSAPEKEPAPAPPPGAWTAEPVAIAWPATVTDTVTIAAKPRQLALAALGRLPDPDDLCPPARVALALPAEAPLAAPLVTGTEQWVSLRRYSPSIYAIALDDGGDNVADVGSLRAIAAAIRAAASQAELRCLLLEGNRRAFMTGALSGNAVPALDEIRRALAEVPCPTVALASGQAQGAGLLLAAASDIAIFSPEAEYATASGGAAGAWSPGQIDLLYARFGRALATFLLGRATPCAGAVLAAAGWRGALLNADAAQSHARALAEALADKPQPALRLLKARLAVAAGGVRANAVESLEVEPVLTSFVPALASPPMTHLISRVAADGMLAIELRGCDAPLSCAAAAAAMATLVRYANEHPGIAAVVLQVTAAEFDRIATAAPAQAVVELGTRLEQLRKPLVVAVEGAAAAPTLWLATHADRTVLDPRASHSASDVWRDPVLAEQVVPAIDKCFGQFGRRLYLDDQRQPSGELQRFGAGFVGVETGEAVVVAGRREAAALACMSPAQLALCRARLDRPALVRGWQALLEGSEPAEAAVPAPQLIALRSKVVQLTAHPFGVVEVAMIDRQAKNLFSDQLMEGMFEAFAKIESHSEFKVVVLTGYDQYFSSGGTKEGLLAIQDGSYQFTDHKVFQLPMQCQLPVIAAMQGHAIGAGWAMGAYADFAILGEESRYVSPYMNYGFTPGAGSTLILPMRLGHDLARESLLTGREFTGKGLAAYGLPWEIAPRAQVLERAHRLARAIARRPRALLVKLKAEWNRGLGIELAAAFEAELELHRATFVGQAEVMRRIEAQFAVVDEGQAPPPAVVAAPAQGRGEVLDVLRVELARELEMEPAAIGDERVLRDIGLDSIIGVSWINRINRRLGINIEATKIYSFPTLVDFADYVARRVGAPAAVGAREVERTTLLADLKADLAHELEMDPENIPDTGNFHDLGVDSIIGVGWIKRVNRRFGTQLAATKIYSHPTLLEFASLLPAPTLSAPADPGVAPAGAVAAPRLRSLRRSAGLADNATVTGGSIAVIGLAGQFPGAADSDEFWRNLAAGRDCITEVPRERWDAQRFYEAPDASGARAGTISSKWMGALADYDCFDPLFFNISPVEAEEMDPQQRLFLQACWQALENAGIDPARLSGSKCGVYVGCGTSDYHPYGQGLGGSVSILAARISYFLDLKGPCVAIDTACSSSLVAIANACDSLLNGSCNIALAGGVCVLSGPAMHLGTSQAGMLSPDGRCYSFDQRANGFVPAEGVGVVLLKRLDDALRDGDIIQGVIEGWGVNQDGKTNGITAPNPLAQSQLQAEVYERFGIDPGQIQLIEAHGTGTKLGDPIEVEALCNAFGRYTQSRGYCALGSVKSNIGHALFAAGAASVIKVLLALRERKLPPTINFAALNEHIRLQDTPFYVNSALCDWLAPPERQPRRAAISSFGFSGTNAHIVLREHVESAPVETTPSRLRRLVVPLSARTEEQLLRRAEALARHLETAITDDFSALVYTLQFGRQSMAKRLVCVAADATELAAQLAAIGRGETPSGVLRAAATAIPPPAPEHLAQVVEQCLAVQDSQRLAELWLSGCELDWQQLYHRRPQRVCLPGYPFAKDRYWHACAPATALAPLAALPVEQPAPLPGAAIDDILQCLVDDTLTAEEGVARLRRVI